MLKNNTELARFTNATTSVELRDFFDALWVPTLLDFQGSPAYGGNRDQVGWKYIGFEDRKNWEPPFGH